MRSLWIRQRDISTAERGHIIQRILVDGWTAEEAAAHLDINERRVRRWVADYRRHGMASLRGDLTAETLPQRCIAWVRSHMSRTATLAQAEGQIAQPAPCVVLHRGDERKRI